MDHHRKRRRVTAPGPSIERSNVCAIASIEDKEKVKCGDAHERRLNEELLHHQMQLSITDNLTEIVNNEG